MFRSIFFIDSVLHEAHKVHSQIEYWLAQVDPPISVCCCHYFFRNFEPSLFQIKNFISLFYSANYSFSLCLWFSHPSIHFRHYYYVFVGCLTFKGRFCFLFHRINDERFYVLGSTNSHTILKPTNLNVCVRCSSCENYRIPFRFIKQYTFLFGRQSIISCTLISIHYVTIQSSLAFISLKESRNIRRLYNLDDTAKTWWVWSN